MHAVARNRRHGDENDDFPCFTGGSCIPSQNMRKSPKHANFRALSRRRRQLPPLENPFEDTREDDSVLIFIIRRKLDAKRLNIKLDKDVVIQFAKYHEQLDSNVKNKDTGMWLNDKDEQTVLTNEEAAAWLRKQFEAPKNGLTLDELVNGKLHPTFSVP